MLAKHALAIFTLISTQALAYPLSSSDDGIVARSEGIHYKDRLFFGIKEETETNGEEKRDVDLVYEKHSANDDSDVKEDYINFWVEDKLEEKRDTAKIYKGLPEKNSDGTLKGDNMNIMIIEEPDVSA